jgi:hypothetical protein
VRCTRYRPARPRRARKHVKTRPFLIDDDDYDFDDDTELHNWMISCPDSEIVP